MKNNIKISQVALLLLTIIPGGKYLSLPVILASQVGRDSWIVVSVLLAFDFVCLAFLLWAVKNNVDSHNFGTILSRSIGKIGSKIVLIVMFLWISLRLVTLLTSVYKLFAVAFSIKTNWIGFCIPMLALLLYAIYKGFRAIVRLNEIFAIVILLSVAFVMIVPLITINKSNLLPLLSNGVEPVMSAVIGNNFWFSDYLFIYFVLSDIKVVKRIFTPVLGAFGAGAILAILLNLLFVALYGSLAGQKDLAMSKVSQFTNLIVNNGRLDWLSLSIWTMSVLIKLSVLGYCVYYCTKQIFSSQSTTFGYGYCIPLVLLFLVPLFVTSDTLLKEGLRYLNIPFMVVKYILPLVMPLLVKVTNKRCHKQLLSEVGR